VFFSYPGFVISTLGGFEVPDLIRQRSNIFVIMLTAKDEVICRQQLWLPVLTIT